MHRRIPAWVLAQLTAAFLACSPALGHAQSAAPPPPSPAVERARQQVDSVNALYIKAFADANVDEVVTLYDSTASELLPKSQVEHGHDALRRYWGNFIKTYGPLRLTLDMVEFWLVNDRAYETGRYTSVIKDTAGKEQRYKGNYATVWQSQPGGGWKIVAVFDTPR